MAYICLDCDCIFDEPKHYTERHGFEYGPFEEWLGCPKCGGAYTETYLCDCCDEWITGDYIKTDDDERFCENCFVHYELGKENN